MLLGFEWQLETVIEKLHQEKPKLAERLGEKRKETLRNRVVAPVEASVCASGRKFTDKWLIMNSCHKVRCQLLHDF